MDLFRRITILLITLSLLNLLGCQTPDEPLTMQPFDGYPLLSNLEEIQSNLKYKCVDTIDFKKGQVIADIGAGNGYLEAMLSMFHDSLTFYIQDIDSTVCNQVAFDEVLDFYQEVNGKPFTNKFIIINGTDSKTNLPDNSFDKIMMLWTYLYLKQPKVFIKDIRNNLKDDGLLYVINPQQEEDEYTKSLRLKYGWNASPLEKQISDIIDCGFQLVRISRNYDSGEYHDPFIMIFRKTITNLRLSVGVHCNVTPQKGAVHNEKMKS